MQVEVIEQGFVARWQPNQSAPIAVGPRAAVTREGHVVCSYMVQSALGVNDFVPVLSRSTDNGNTWREESPIWPHLSATRSLFGSISRAPQGPLFMYGISTPIDKPGESFWSKKTQGMKQNSLFWAVSEDNGKTWTDPCTIALPYPGAAEAPGPLCIMRGGRWVACYATYNTFDSETVVDRRKVVCLFSDDEGKTWRHGVMHLFAEQDSGGAEAWIVELSDSRLLGTSWHIDHSDRQDYPNAWSLSSDGGSSWSPTRSTGIMGQATSLAARSDGTALFAYNQRKHAEAGVWLAHVRPTDNDFGILSNQIAWRAETATQSGTSGDHSQWDDFSFGEPSLAVLPDGDLLLLFWCIQPQGQGIAYVKLRTLGDQE